MHGLLIIKARSLNIPHPKPPSRHNHHFRTLTPILQTITENITRFQRGRQQL
ncbi:hypothetical protein THIOM_000159 [Candidatus Thiomargarita nelsonii]|uniref:Uncharacterized protein n=1 Tax=Candidatus Thiomargarita nelsonii TaxID=1003181 RepID=A0A176S7W0_9GAMM|nr:hypothetical protein THIOM_000159 [Candidatus Thiomargarita nelsonii]